MGAQDRSRSSLDMKVHPAADIVPLLEGEAYEALKTDIRQNGQQLPIALWMGEVLDGRNRLRACRDLGISPLVHELRSLPAESPTMYVLSANLHRRHLTPSQLAMVGARARQHFDAEAKLRQARKSAAGDERGDARDRAGQAVGVSGKTIDYASRVLRSGVPELVAACETGKLTVSRASQLVDLTPELQRKAILARGPSPCVAARSRSRAHGRSKGAAFDQVITRARDLQELLHSVGSAKTLVDSGQFDATVLHRALKQLDAAVATIRAWSQQAKHDLGVMPSARETNGHGAVHAP